MDLDETLRALARPAADAVRRHGLHKVAGAIAGVEEMSLKEATTLLGAHAYMRRREFQKIAMGLRALADLSGVKLADMPWGALLQKSLPYAIGGGVIGALPDLMAEGPLNKDLALQHALAGAAIGGTAGGASTLHQLARRNPAIGEQILAGMVPR